MQGKFLITLLLLPIYVLTGTGLVESMTTAGEEIDGCNSCCAASRQSDNSGERSVFCNCLPQNGSGSTVQAAITSGKVRFSNFRLFAAVQWSSLPGERSLWIGTFARILQPALFSSLLFRFDAASPLVLRI
jgi:hypothetical protein